MIIVYTATILFIKNIEGIQKLMNEVIVYSDLINARNYLMKRAWNLYKTY